MATRNFQADHWGLRRGSGVPEWLYMLWDGGPEEGLLGLDFCHPPHHPAPSLSLDVMFQRIHSQNAESSSDVSKYVGALVYEICKQIRIYT